jgi:hypothetical protein
MDSLIGRELVKVVRLAWRRADGRGDPQSGPVQLVFDDGRGLVLCGRSDWTVRLVWTGPHDDSWLAAYDYVHDGGRWLARDASMEFPFASFIGRRLDDLDPVLNELDEVVGLRLDFACQILTLSLWEGEVRI